jgi:hypothetical protein
VWSDNLELCFHNLVPGQKTEIKPYLPGAFSQITASMSFDGRIAISGQRSSMCQEDIVQELAVWDVERASSKHTYVDAFPYDAGCLMLDGKSIVFKTCTHVDENENQSWPPEDEEMEVYFKLLRFQFSNADGLPELNHAHTSTVIKLDHVDDCDYFSSSSYCLAPMPDPNRVRIINSQTFVVDLSSDMKPYRCEDWSVFWHDKSVPFWGGGGFRRLVADGQSGNHTHEIDSADGEWVISWHADQVEIKKWPENEPRIIMVYSHKIENVSIDKGLKVIAVESPPGKLTFFNTNKPLQTSPLVATACRHIFSEDGPTSTPFVFPPCCAIAYTPDSELIEKITDLSLFHQTLNSFDSIALLTNCPHCQTQLKFNPFFIDIRRFESGVRGC